jgi:hypothetical protein
MSDLVGCLTRLIRVGGTLSIYAYYFTFLLGRGPSATDSNGLEWLSDFCSNLFGLALSGSPSCRRNA